MSNIEESIEVKVPVRTAYNQWTQFEEFPQFMDGVDSVTQLDDKTMRWVADIAGAKREWTAEITEQIPDDRIAWKSIDPNVQHAGVVTFHRISDDTCKVMLQFDFQPTDMVEKAGDMLGFVKRRVKGDLERFATFIEERGTETGAWRGEVEQGQVSSK